MIEETHKTLNNHIYIYQIQDNCVVWDCSVPRDCVNRAKERVVELESMGLEAFYIIGDTFKGAFY